jgi:hypothetical protein
MVRVAGQLEWELGKGRAVEHVDDVHAHGVERALVVACGDDRCDVIGDRVRPKQPEEGVLEWKVAGVTRGVSELRVSQHLAGFAVYTQEASLVGWKPPVADTRRVRWDRHEQVEALGAPTGEGRLVRMNVGQALGGAPLDAEARYRA